MDKSQSQSQVRPVRESLEEYGRGVIGGLLFSLPILYTMEVWWRGFTATPLELMFYLLATFVMLLAYNRYSGMRPDATLAEVAMDSIEEMGLGLAISAGVLFLLGRIAPGMPFQEILGKVVVEAMTVAIGVSVGTAQLGATSNEGREEKAARRDPGVWDQAVIGFCGAILIASNVAPTEEILIIAIEAGPAKLLGLALLSLTICAVTLHFSHFVGSEHHVRKDQLFGAVSGTVVAYALALLASALMLWFFDRFQGVSTSVLVSQVVVLALPAALGASAGRLLIQ